MSHPAKKPHVFCLPSEKHFSHQKSLSEGGITLQHLKLLFWALPGLISWRDGNTPGSVQERECLKEHRCLKAAQTIPSHFGPYKRWGAVNSGLLICIHTSDGLFFFPWEAKGRKENTEIEQGSFSAGVSLSCSRRSSSLTPINTSRGSADFKWNIKSHWDRNNSFMPTSVLNTIKFWAWTPARSFQK